MKSSTATRPVAVPAQRSTDSGKAKQKRNPWRTVQFALAAASAVPLLFWGGLTGWPWEKQSADAATSDSAGAVEQADPVSLKLGRINMNVSLQPLSIDPKTNSLTEPAYGKAGWYQAGPEPGELGRSVIFGHNVRPSGQADVFADLGKVRKGDVLTVVNAKGVKLNFIVRSVETFALDKMPADRLFGGDRQTSQLRIFAPTGSAKDGKYSKDVVVFADLTA